ncbi:SDR family NAD(P)-dependent oxidoreductase [Actinomycetota bacterium]
MARAPIGPLAGSVAIVTGAAGDIGQAIAMALLRSGASVALADIDTVDASIHPPDDEVDAGLPAVSSHRVDVTDAQSCEELIAQVKSTYGGVDIVVNNAGINVRKVLVDTTEEEWLRIQDVNVNGAFRMCRAAYATLRSGRNSTVVNVASTAGIVGIPATAAYGVSKAGLIQLTRALAAEWAVDAIRVNAVAPTIVRSEMTSDIVGDEWALRQKLSTIPLGRVVEPDEVGAAVSYLASPDARSITGHTLLLDGGFTAT